eukprot:5591844-Pleurochrysis_carterae.AAC.1
MPMVAFAPTARRPLIAPGFVRLGPRPLRVGGLLVARVSAHGEGMCGTGIGFELAAYVPCFCVAQDTAGGCNG